MILKGDEIMQKKNGVKKQITLLLAGMMMICVLLSTGLALQIPKMAKAAKKIIITIDPGHGGKEKGAYIRYKGRLRCEKNLNLRIAKYMKKELETYKNVKVYLTRSSDRTLSLADRVRIAKKNNSDLFFSVHNNAGGYSYHDGACALISSGQYHKELSTVAETIGRVVLERISASVGMVNRGYLRRLSKISKYPNKKPADYYAIIRGGTEAGITSMIIEHGFVDNKKDLKKLIKKSVQKKLGQADARAVANYYGLAKKNGKKKYKKLGPAIKMVTKHWMKKDGKYYYVTKKERIIKNCTKIINGKKYKFGKTGICLNYR